MSYESAANIITAIHVILIFGIFLGILISARYKKFRPIESIILLIAILIWSLYRGCPLTYLENWLRIQAGHPLPLLQNGFISFYTNKWFGLFITDKEITEITYITALLFCTVSFEWLAPYVNFELVRVRKMFR